MQLHQNHHRCPAAEHARVVRCPAAATERAAPHAVSSPVRAPHSGYHFDGRSGRFFEGWLECTPAGAQVNLPEPGQSFAFIYSVEDPGSTSRNTGMAAQIMGPDDSYLLQYLKSTDDFWADPDSLALGACFKHATPGHRSRPGLVQELLTEPDRQRASQRFDASVSQGYVASQRWHRGSIISVHGSADGQPESSVSHAQWDFTVEPQFGWGDPGGKQKATAGWLAALPVFEPHWQVLMARGTASGYIDWGGKRHEFTGAPAYSEKNWGAGFPKKWWWVQAEDFEGAPDVALTAVGAKRGVKALPGLEEDVGMIGLHWGDQFLELVPWTGQVAWQVEPWGSWRIQASNEQYRAELEAVCKRPGSLLRAPTPNNGLQPACRDSFFGEVRVRVWRAGQAQAALDVTSSSAAVEVGGGPWERAWEAEADMKQPLRSLLALNVDVEGISRSLPQALQVKGL